MSIKDEDYLKHIENITGSKSLCLAKWYNATIWLGSGQTTSCHHPPAHAIDKEALTDNPSAIHNTDQKKMDRLMMQNGERPEGCSYCWKLEDMGQVSDRVYKTKIHDRKGKYTSTLEVASTLDFKEDVNLKTLEISFDRTCQFACSYCNPAFSTTWAKDINTNGPYQGLVSDGRGHFTHAHNASQPYKVGEENPYVTAFMEWWESDLKSSLKELRITGGEPLMSPETWKVLESYYEKPDNNEVRILPQLAINTNLGCSESLFNNLIGYSHSIQGFDIYTSNEATFHQAEYIRDGLDYDLWLDRVDRLIFDSGIRQLHNMATINALSLFSLTEFLDQLLALKEKAGSRDAINFTLNILRFPSFQSCLVLPEDIRKKIRTELGMWWFKNAANELLHPHEKDHLHRLIEYLREPAPHDIDKLRQDFKAFYAQYDKRRNKSFENTFPEELVDWYKTL